jgi:tetratricopeptide (TPR) repeat protein
MTIEASSVLSPGLGPGRVVAGRYRIERMLGQGAMGEVYEAEDLELGERVALKALRPDIARDERLLLRFKKEILLAHRVTHPNACRTFDLVYDDGPDGARTALLSMELLHGETLADRLARQGRMRPDEALPIVRQIAAALDAAHGAGVVHRDLKSANAFLEPSADGGVRAVVTDFGLAWSREPEGSPSSGLTMAGELLGSPAYMAPEQVRGRATTPATDVYALGVVLFEMMTGELPFLGDSAFDTALRRLREPAPSPRRRAPDLPPVWERAILRALAREPGERFASAGDLVRALEGQPGEARQGRHTRHAREIALGAALLALILAAGLILVPFGSHPRPAAAVGATLAARPSLAVLGFDNLTREPRVDYIGSALVQMLPTELAAAERLRLIPVENVDRAIHDLRLPRVSGLSLETLGRLRQRLGADLVVTGAYLVTSKGRTRFDVMVQDARSGATVATLREEGTEESLLTSLDSLGGRLRSSLTDGREPAQAGEAVRAALPDPGAVRLYAEGLARLRRFDAPAARDLLARAAAADPDNPLIRSALAAAWSELGEDGHARDEARRAFELSGRLRREDHRDIEARYREMAHEWEAAIEIESDLLRAAPDDLEIGLRLAATEIAAGHSADAAATLAALRRLPPLLSRDPRIDLIEARAAGDRSEYALQLAAAVRAERRGAEQRSPLLVAAARLQEAQARRRLGDKDAAEAACERAAQLFVAAGNRRGEAEALRARGEILADETRFEDARALYERALAIHREIGDERGVGETERLLGLVLSDQGETQPATEALALARRTMEETRNRRGLADVLHAEARMRLVEGDLTGARGLWEQAIPIQRETLYRQAEAKSLQGLGLIDTQEGNLEAALRSYRRALALQRGNGDRRGTLTVLHNEAPVLFELGHLDEARKAREEALAIARQIDDRQGIARGLRGVADVVRQQGDLAAAHGLYGKALAIYRELGLRDGEMAMQDEIATTLILEGKPRDALVTLEAPLAFCRERGAPKEEASVLVDHGRALWLVHDLAGADADLERALAASREAGDTRGTAEALVALALVDRDRGRVAAAQSRLAEALAIFRHRGNRSGEASALYALGTVLAREGDFSAARVRHEEARALRAALGERLAVAESARALAEIGPTVPSGPIGPIS